MFFPLRNKGADESYRRIVSVVHCVWVLASYDATSQSHDDKMALVDSLFSALPTGEQ